MRKRRRCSRKEIERKQRAVWQWYARQMDKVDEWERNALAKVKPPQIYHDLLERIDRISNMLKRHIKSQAESAMQACWALMPPTPAVPPPPGRASPQLQGRFATQSSQQQQQPEVGLPPPPEITPVPIPPAPPEFPELPVVQCLEAVEQWRWNEMQRVDEWADREAHELQSAVRAWMARYRRKIREIARNTRGWIRETLQNALREARECKTPKLGEIGVGGMPEPPSLARFENWVLTPPRKSPPPTAFMQ